MNRRICNRLGVVTAGIATLGGSVAAVVRSQRSVRPLPVNHAGGTQRRMRVQGHEVFVSEQGSGPPLLLIHGVYAGASSYEFRYIIDLLSKSHRVFAFDFLGCGLSDHPRLQYTADLFVEQIVTLVKELTEEPVSLVGSSYGAAYAIAAAAKLGKKARAVVGLSPSGIASPDGKTPLARRVGNRLFTLPLIGSAAYELLVSDAVVKMYLQRVYSDPSRVDAEMLAHFHAVTHTPGSRAVVAAFVGGALDCDLTSELPFLDTPILLISGDGPRIGKNDGDTIATLGNRVSSTTFKQCGALPHEEQAEATADAILRFVEDVGEASST